MTLVLAEDQISNTNVRLCPLLARKLPDCSRPKASGEKAKVLASRHALR